MLEYGTEGRLEKNGTIREERLTYIVFEYIEDGGVLYNLCEKAGALGEEVGRLLTV